MCWAFVVLVNKFFFSCFQGGIIQQLSLIIYLGLKMDCLEQDQPYRQMTNSNFQETLAVINFDVLSCLGIWPSSNY